jgi:2-iminobutanoate/2-iminopropanoate deaminase
VAVEREHLTGERETTRSYSRAVSTRGGRTIYLAGVVDVDETGTPVVGPFEASARAVLDRLREAVEAAGGQLADVVTMTVYITDARFGDDFARVRAEYFAEGRYPASALVTCTALARPDLRVEIQATAVTDD